MIDNRALILHHALPHVPFDGWSEHTLAQGAKTAGLETTAVKSAYPGGPMQAVDYFFALADDALAKSVSAESLAVLRVPDRIEALILWLLEYFSPHREPVRAAVAAYALPWNAGHATRAMYHTTDRIWRLAGENATDFSHYTKRATLAGVYGSTVLYWLNDHSENGADTREFLKRRLANVAAFGKWKRELAGKFHSRHTR